MSIATEAVPPRPISLAPSPASNPGWLMGPAVDLFFVANAAWPVLTLVVMLGSEIVNNTLTFWQVYLLSTPHRWITLGLVFLDRERFLQRRGAFLGLAFLAVALVLSVYLSTGTVLLLVAIDFFWNAWHFAAQHSGISRIYARAARPDVQSNGLFEKVLLRAFVLYAILRVGLPFATEEASVAWLDGLKWVLEGMRFLDFYVLALPAVLLVNELRDFRRAVLPRLIYLASVCGMYTTMVVLIHFNDGDRFKPILTGLFLANAAFHATEYMAIVSWSVQKRHGRGKSGLFAALLPRWGLNLLVFMIVLGWSAWLINEHFIHFWAILTIIVSYLHYAYDGMIWKVRRPASAAVA